MLTVKTNAAFEKWKEEIEKHLHLWGHFGSKWLVDLGAWRELPLLTRAFRTDAIGLFALKVVIKIVAMGSWH